MKTFKEYLQEENTQGDIGTRKLALHHLRFTPGQLEDPEEQLKEFKRKMDDQF